METVADFIFLSSKITGTVTAAMKLKDTCSLETSLVAQMVKRLPAVREACVQSLGREDSPGGGNGNPLQYSLLENPHGQKGLVGYSPWGRKELDTTEQLSTAQCRKAQKFQHVLGETESGVSYL